MLRLLPAVALLTLVIPQSARADSADPRAQRERVRAQRTEAARKLDALNASSADVRKTLDGLDSNIGEQQTEVKVATRQAEEAARLVDDARAAVTAKQAQLDNAQGSLRQLAIDAYTNNTQDIALDVLSLDTGDDEAFRLSMTQLQAQRLSDASAEFDQVREDLTGLRKRAEGAQTRADNSLRQKQQQLADLQDTQNAQQDLADRLDSALERELAEAAGLADQDRALSASISRLDAATAARVGRLARPSGVPGSPVGADQITTVRGIRVHQSIAAAVDQLLAAAAADGVNLSGTGYRSSAGQIATREANCGSGDYNIYQKPASQCHPPTARPGSSMHERGLAIDFTYNGSIISSRSNPGYKWMAANAGRFGLFNLPSEAWHWSTTGN
ncbi:MAG: Peptidoglycan-binding domain 1 protein [Acidimicrobiia bacterium]|nr:Peptidoglycan-binding domain 1 protein [Acidimicrobiia bacterium]